MDKHFIKKKDGEELGRLISNKREELGYSMEHLAEKFGTTRQNIRRYEIWDLKKPDMPLLEGLFEYLGLDRSIIPMPFKKTIQKAIPESDEELLKKLEAAQKKIQALETLIEIYRSENK